MHSENIRSLPYCADSELYMRALGELGMPVFLDSANHGGRNGSKDILAAEPAAYIRIENGVYSCSDNVKYLLGCSTDSSVFMSNIRQLKEIFIPLSAEKPKQSQPPEYAGSIVGYIGYPSLTSKVSFSIDDAFVGVYLWMLVVDHELKSCELRMHPSCSAHSSDRILSLVQQSLRRATERPPAQFTLDSPFTNSTSAEQYRDAFSKIKTHISNGDCYQVNLSQRFTAMCNGDPLAAYLKLRQATTTPFSAYMNWGSGALLSLSPERFLNFEDGAVLTQPIKGTRPRGASEEEDQRLADELAQSEKDRAENLMIVDLLRNDLGRVCETGSIDINQLFAIESYRNVHHMVSDVVGRLSADRDAIDLLQNCYPGGSITGAPKLAAMQIIEDLECDARRVYCGTVFCLGAEGNLDSSITIRSLLWQPGALHCWAGGGIVADSECEQEYQECFDKINNIFSALQSPY